MTIEGSGGLSLEEQNRRLDLIIAGEHGAPSSRHRADILGTEQGGQAY